jgi:hypothetical protein
MGPLLETELQVVNSLQQIAAHKGANLLDSDSRYRLLTGVLPRSPPGRP